MNLAPQEDANTNLESSEDFEMISQPDNSEPTEITPPPTSREEGVTSSLSDSPPVEEVGGAVESGRSVSSITNNDQEDADTFSVVSSGSRKVTEGL